MREIKKAKVFERNVFFVPSEQQKKKTHWNLSSVRLVVQRVKSHMSYSQFVT